MNGKVAHYVSVLGLTAPITSTDVKAAYRREIRKWHPDVYHGKEASSHVLARAQKLNEAYEFLSEITKKQAIPAAESQKAKTHDQYRTRHTYQGQAFKPGFPDTTVFEVFVKSSMLISVGYNSAQRILYLKFHRGSIYRYLNVPKVIFDELLSVNSIGKYVNSKISRNFTCESCR